jgi:dTDP-4-dehydrorhamnose reductase
MAIKRVAVTGANGMLGRELCDYLSLKGVDVLRLSREHCDLLATGDAILRAFEGFEPQVIIHAAAMTNVDAAETQPELAMAINKDGTQKLIDVAKAFDCVLAYISTDYVFDGEEQTPYSIHQRPKPINAYGLSKYYGELLVQEQLDMAYIIRTSWLFGRHRRNFVDIVISHLKTGQPMPVVSDQVGSPSWTGSVVAQIEQIIQSGRYGIYHAVSEGMASRLEQARFIARALQLSEGVLTPISRVALNSKTPRPRFTALNPAPLAAPHWQTSLEAYLTQAHR